MREFIFRLNVEHYQRLIAAEPDTAKRARLERMLAEELERLRACRVDPASAALQDCANDGLGAPQPEPDQPGFRDPIPAPEELIPGRPRARRLAEMPVSAARFAHRLIKGVFGFSESLPR